MEQITLKGKKRAAITKAATKELRRSGQVPAVLYGQKQENIHFAVDAKELSSVTHTPNSYIINLDVEGEKHLAVFHAAQFHPVTDNTLHVDFLKVSEDKPVVIDVPVNVFGNSEGVKQGGKLMVSSRKLRVSGLLGSLPDKLDVDITTLKLGKQISAGDLSYPGITIISPKGTVVCSVKMTRAAIGAAAAAAAAKN